MFVKFGGSVITEKEKPYTVNLDKLKMLCEEVVRARREYGVRILIGHGGGSFPHTSAEKYRTHDGFVDEKSSYGFCVVGMDAAKLNMIVVDELLKMGENAFTVRVSSAAIARNGKICRWDTELVNHLFELDITPVTYGDVIIDLARGFAIVSTEEIFRYLARELEPEKVLLISKHAVHTSDPQLNDNAEKISLLRKSEFYGINLSRSHGFDVTGGMMKKVEIAFDIARYAEHVEIIPAERGNLLKAIAGKSVGTVIEL